MNIDLDRIRANVKSATTEDLLDRATVYRDGMEPQALVLVEWELEQRGVTLEAVEAHRESRKELLLDKIGQPLTCSFCDRPAATRVWGWHRMWGRIPIFRRRFRYCTVCAERAGLAEREVPET